jgi:hypothetical protein
MEVLSKNEKTLIKFNEYVNKLIPHVRMYGWKGVDKLRRELGVSGITKKQFVASGLNKYLALEDVVLDRDVTDSIRAKIYPKGVISEETTTDLPELSVTLNVDSAPIQCWQDLPEYQRLKNTSSYPWVRIFEIDGQLCVFATRTRFSTEYLLGANIKFDGSRPILGAIKRDGTIPSKGVEYSLTYPQYRCILWTILNDTQVRFENLENEILSSRDTIRELQSTIDEGKALIEEKVSKIVKLMTENAELKAFLDTIAAERDEYREKYRDMNNATFLQKIARLFK